MRTISTVTVGATHAAAESAFEEPQKSGFAVKKLSVIGRGYLTDGHAAGY